jgi:hypothetical protein
LIEDNCGHRSTPREQASACRSPRVPALPPICAPGSLVNVIFAFIARTRLGLGGTEGIGDAGVGDVGLAVDEVGVDLQQDGDAVPGAAGDLVGLYPEIQPQRYRCGRPAAPFAWAAVTSRWGLGSVLVLVPVPVADRGRRERAGSRGACR